jgi:citrate lyase subunit beta/citryl-CoA lyase
MTLRSLLFVPADSERKLARGADAGADALILDLEDSVLPERKHHARALASDYLLKARGGLPLWVRVNDLAGGALLTDLNAVVPGRPAGIVLPKIRGPEDVMVLAHYLDALEAAHGLPAGGIKILALVTETPSAVLRMGELLKLSGSPVAAPRMAALGWGAEDLSSSLGAGDPRLPNGAWRPLYEQVRGHCLLASHALGVEAIETVYVDFRDTGGLARACDSSRHDGFTGRFAIHPDQVPVINRAFTPSPAEIEVARRVVAAFGAGAGAVSLDGKMLDLPHLAAARRLLTRAPAADALAPSQTMPYTDTVR